MFKIISRDEARACGLPRFFTGTPCKHGHIAQRYVNGRVCCECQKVNSRRFAVTHPDRIEQNRSSQKTKNPTYFKDFYRRNAEKRKADAAGWYEANKERALKACKEWAAANPEKRREAGRLNRRKRRARLASVGGTHTRADLHRIFERQRGRCAICDCRLSKSHPEVDHIIPLALGGDNSAANLQYLCRPCNRSKSAKHPIEFAQERGRLL